MYLISKNEKETITIGYKLGKLLKEGDIVCFFGDLGSGKTTMIKGIGKALGIDEKDIISASFTIVTEYHSTPPLIHIDLYRIEKEEEIDNIGLWEFLENKNITVIEWADKIKKYLPDNSIKLYIKHINENLREILVEGINEKDWNNFKT